MSAGFVYVLANDSMPGLVKVGKTTRSPESRASELYVTGVPLPFRIVTAIYTKHMDEVERDVHWCLDRKESNGG